MTQKALKQRTKDFALRIIRLADAIPQTRSGRAIAGQIIRSGTSVGANYRAACRSKSDRDFLNKLVIIEEEADETAYWLELLLESGMMPKEQLHALQREADELTAIFTASGKTVRERLRSPLDKTNGYTSEPLIEYPLETHNPESEIRNPE